MTKKAKLTAAGGQPTQRLIYCGPNIPGLAVSGNVFTALSPALQGHFDACPVLNTFLVPVSKYQRTRDAIARSGSIESVRYLEAKRYLAERR